MNFFFFLKDKNYSFNLTIPKFTNEGTNLKSLNLYSLKISKSENLTYWHCEKIAQSEEKFFKIDNSQYTKNTFFFIASEKILNQLFNKEKTEIRLIKNFLDTTPPFRANTKIFKNDHGFSSYQSEYPISMIMKKGSIATPVNMLLNPEAEINKIFFVNIFFKPVEEKFKYYLIDFKLKKILYSEYIYTNNVNIINLDKKYIKENIFFVTKDYLGIPIYFSDLNGHLSLEHTHPPHEYIFGKKKFQIIKKFKEDFGEIINKENI